jgi:biopolymer transport protein ExbD
MAGVSVGEAPDNPVAINITAMVDIIFCLCVFFMCSLHFKQLEGKFDTWLPKSKGAQGMPLNAVIEEIRVALFWDEAKQEVVRKIGTRVVPEDEILQELMAESFADFKRLNKPDISLTIDAEAKVPWGDVVNIINLGKRVGIDKVEFAFGTKSGP